MKKIILILAILFGSLSLFAQEPIVKFYLNDGSTKQYNISEIENISVLTGSSNYIMNIYEHGSQISNFSTKIIELIKFDIDVSNNQVLNIYISGKANSFKLLEVDSINFKISEEPLPQITSINPASGKIGDEITITGNNFGDTQFSIYPNPADDFLTISGAFKNNTDINIRLINLLGTEILNLNKSNVKNLYQNLNISNLSSGMYILELRFGGESVQRKIIKK